LCGIKASSAYILLNVKSQGFQTLFNELSSLLLRQATYTTSRLGVHTNLLEKFSNPGGSSLGFFKNVSVDMSAQACGAIVRTRVEISLIRMTVDGNIPAT